MDGEENNSRKVYKYCANYYNLQIELNIQYGENLATSSCKFCQDFLNFFSFHTLSACLLAGYIRLKFPLMCQGYD